MKRQDNYNIKNKTMEKRETEIQATNNKEFDKLKLCLLAKNCLLCSLNLKKENTVMLFLLSCVIFSQFKKCNSIFFL